MTSIMFTLQPVDHTGRSEAFHNKLGSIAPSERAHAMQAGIARTGTPHHILRLKLCLCIT